MHQGNNGMSVCGMKTKAGLLLIFGILFFLGTLGVWPEFTFAKYWPLPLILWGLHGLVCPCCKMGKGKMCGCGGEGECCKK